MDKTKLLDIIQSYIKGEISEYIFDRAISSYGRGEYERGYRAGDKNATNYWQDRIRMGDFDA